MSPLATLRAFVSEELKVRQSSYMPRPETDEQADIDEAQAALDACEEVYRSVLNLIACTECWCDERANQNSCFRCQAYRAIAAGSVTKAEGKDA